MSYSSTILATAGLVSYWRLGETSGTSAADSIGTNTGTYTNGPTIGAAGVIVGDTDTAVTMTTASSQYVTVPDSSSLDLGDTFSVEFWVKLTSSPTVPFCFVDRGAGSWIVRTADSGTAFVLRKNGTSTLVTSTITLTIGRRYHIVVTKSTSTIHLWANNADVTGAVTNATMTNNALPLCIGGADGGTNDFLNGMIDEVAVYSVALSAATVQSHYIAGINSNLAGTLSLSGSQARSTARSFAGTMTATGVVSRLTRRAVSGTLSGTGAVARASRRALSASLSHAGALAKVTRRSFAASITDTATLAASRLRLMALTATLTTTGVMSRATSRKWAAALTATGALRRRVARSLPASLTPSGRVSRASARALAAAITPAGHTSKRTIRALPAALAPSGAIRRQTRRALAAALTGTGAVVSALTAVARVRLPGLVRPSDRRGEAGPTQRTGRSSPSSDEGKS